VRIEIVDDLPKSAHDARQGIVRNPHGDGVLAGRGIDVSTWRQEIDAALSGGAPDGAPCTWPYEYV